MSLSVLNRGGVSGGLTGIICVNGLSEADTVTAVKGNKTLAGVWTQKPNPAIVVPSGYTQLEYIESTGTQDLNMGVSVPHASSKIIVEFSTDDVNQDAPITGHIYPSWSWNVNMLIVSGGKFAVNGGLTDIDAKPNVKYTVEYTSQYYEINGTRAAKSYSGTDGRADTVFSGGSKYGKYKLYSYKLYDGSNLIRHLIPAKRNSDGVLGAYDIKNNVFYTNVGTGAFKAGAEIPQYVEYHEISGIKDLGTWTITATNGTDTITQDVLIEVIGLYEIELDINELFVVRSWYLRSNTSGVQSYHIPTKNEPYFEGSSKYINSSSQGHLGVDMDDPVSMTDVKTVRVFVEQVAVSNTAYCPFIVISTTKGEFWADNAPKSLKFTQSVTSPKAFDIDVSNLAGDYYIGIRVIGGYNPITTHSLTVSSIKKIY